MDEHLLRSFRAELESPMLKQALIERLIRLGATDVEDLPGVNKVIKKTPRLFMRKRSPEELAQLQHGVQNFFDRYEQPAIARAESAINKLPTENKKVKGILNAGAKTVIKNPELLATELSPIPGTGVAWLAAKRGLEKAIDRVAPLKTP